MATMKDIIQSPLLLALVIGGLVIAVGVGVLAKRPGLAWLNNFVMAFSMLGGLISSLAWVRIFG